MNNEQFNLTETLRQDLKNNLEEMKEDPLISSNLIKELKNMYMYTETYFPLLIEAIKNYETK